MVSNWYGPRQCVEGKNQSTSIKLFLLCDNKHGYAIDVWLYTRRRGGIRGTG